MKIFKEFISVVNRTFGAFGLGFGMSTLFSGRYEIAAWSLFIVSVLFMTGYFAERWSSM